MSMTQGQMSLEFHRLRGAIACENLMGKYSCYFTAARMKECAALFARDKDTRITMPWGVYRGEDAAERLFLRDYADRTAEERISELQGRLVINDMCGGVVEVAGDGQTARGVWMHPGIETYAPGGVAQAYWNWSTIAADFMKLGGEWKIWHLAKYVQYTTPYFQDWGESEKFIAEPARNSSDGPAPEQYYYAADAVYPETEPALPEPYGTWEEVKEGY